MTFDLDVELNSALDPDVLLMPYCAADLSAVEYEQAPTTPVIFAGRVVAAQTPPYLARRRSLWQQTQQGLAIRTSHTFKGQYARRVSGAKAAIAKEGSLNKLARYYMQGGMHTKAYGRILEALSGLYELMLARPDHELIMRLGGYSPAVGYMMYAAFMHNPNNLLSWIAKQHSQTYAHKSFCTTKAIRKRTKVRQNVRCVHVPQEARLSQSLRNLHFFTEDQKYANFEERIFFALIDTIFKYKKGVIYLRKLHAYRVAFNKAKQRQTS